MKRKNDHLRLVETFRSLFSSLRRNRIDLIRALILPVMCIVGVHIYRVVYSWNFTGDKIEYAIVINIVMIVSILLWPLLAVSCHRVLLEDSDEPSMLDGVWPGWRQIKYYSTAIVVAIPMIAYVFSTMIVREALYESYGDDLSIIARVSADWAILIPAQYLTSRIALTLPAAALQRPLSFSRAWILSRGNGWRITAILLVAPAVSELIYQISFPLWEVAPAAFNGIRILTYLSVGIISIGALSICYQFIVEERRPSS